MTEFQLELALWDLHFRDHGFVLRQFETQLLSFLRSVNTTLSLDVSYLLLITSGIGPAPKSTSLCCLARWVLAGPALSLRGQASVAFSGQGHCQMKQEVQLLRGDSKTE